VENDIVLNEYRRTIEEKHKVIVVDISTIIRKIEVISLTKAS
jgi:hypothetical protein